MVGLFYGDVNMKLNLPQIIRDAVNEWLGHYDGHYGAAWEDLRQRPEDVLFDAGPNWDELLGVYGVDLYDELWKVLNQTFLDVCLSIVSTRLLLLGDKDD